MGDVVRMADRSRHLQAFTIEKMVDGQVVRCVDVDALSPVERERYFSGVRAEVVTLGRHADLLRPAWRGDQT